MKRIMLILLCTLNLSFNVNACDPKNTLKTQSWQKTAKKAACITVALISLAAIIPALRSDLKAVPGTAQAEIPLVILPMSTFLLSCLLAGDDKEIGNPEL